MFVAGKTTEFCTGADRARTGTGFASKSTAAVQPPESRNRPFAAILYTYM
ncbi:hypothetical protein ACVW1A_007515 [Bradyrhizobium sp. LB1.3]